MNDRVSDYLLRFGAGVLTAAGVVTVLVGYVQLRDEADVVLQLPYLMSAGVGGLVLRRARGADPDPVPAAGPDPTLRRDHRTARRLEGGRPGRDPHLPRELRDRAGDPASPPARGPSGPGEGPVSRTPLLQRPRVRRHGRRARRRRRRRSRTVASSTSGPASTATRASTAPGARCLPGLFDCHAHVTFSHVDIVAAARDAVLATSSSRRPGTSARTLETGITTVRDAGGADLGVKQAVDDGLIAGPRMQIAITMISQTGGHGDGWVRLRRRGAVHRFSRCRTRASPRRRRRARRDAPDGRAQLVRAGADVIKVATCGGVLSPRDDPRHGHFRDDELDVLVAEATAAGRGGHGPRPGHRRHQGGACAPASARSSTASTSTTRPST